MMEAPATELEERAMDSTKNMAKGSAYFLCNNLLHSGEGVWLNDNTGDIHLMG